MAKGRTSPIAVVTGTAKAVLVVTEIAVKVIQQIFSLFKRR